MSSAEDEPAFDPAAYKQEMLLQSDMAAEAWYRWREVVELWWADATRLLLDKASIAAGDVVLDLAAGVGGQSIAALERVTATGSVVAVDVSASSLSLAQERVRACGFDNLEVEVGDAETFGRDGASFDAVISRIGLTYFTDCVGTLGRTHALLRDGGKISAAVYSTAGSNGFLSIPIEVIGRRAAVPPPPQVQPGPFSLGDPEALRSVVEEAGFSEVEVCAVSSPILLESAARFVEFERDCFVGLSRMMRNLGPVEQEAVWDEISALLAELEGPDGFAGPCELLVVSGLKLGNTPLVRQGP
jgi:SAM-dependent methyltransferase